MSSPVRYNTDTTEGGGGFLVRLTDNGAVDPGFGPSNTPPLHIQTTDGNVEDLLLQPDGKIVVSGGFSHIFDDSGSRGAPRHRPVLRQRLAGQHLYPESGPA